MDVAWVLGPAEEGMRLPAGARAWRSLPLPGLAAALAACALFVGNDSGTTHLAAACGCPTLALFGPTDPAAWAPRGRAARVLASRDRAMGSIGVAEAWEAVVSLEGSVDPR
jgi:ADP-heptose:LPS heptosyltransferase